jgi:hypothetical protein
MVFCIWLLKEIQIYKEPQKFVFRSVEMIRHHTGWGGRALCSSDQVAIACLEVNGVGRCKYFTEYTKVTNACLDIFLILLMFNIF